MSVERRIYPNTRDAAEHCGDHIVNLLRMRLGGQPRAALAISGGSSPRPMFEHMARAGLDWKSVHVFWVDERGVPPNDPQSNYRMAEETLLGPANIPSSNVHRIYAELTPEEAALRYDQELQAFFGLSPGEMPRFDVVHRGIGPDAHTASLFPGEPLIEDRQNLAAAVYVEKFRQWRVTMLPGVLLAARNTVMLVTGADKAEAVQHIFNGPSDAKKYPAQAVAGQTDETWFFDADAARLIDNR